MKILYLSTWDFTNEEADGVCKKIYSQIAVFEKNGYDVDFIYIKDGKVIYRENRTERVLGKVGSIKKTPAYIIMYKGLRDKAYDWVYNRYGMMDTFYYRVLKRLHKNGARILIEIPTYPYIHEMPAGFLYRIMAGWDKIYSAKLKKCVDRIATYSQDDEIFGIKTIKIKNGIDFNSISVRKPQNETDEIRLIAVAGLTRWYGYDRILKGLGEYYRQGGNRRIVMHIIGKGSVSKDYERIVEQYGIEEHYVYHGEKSGEELDRLYNICDIGIESLGTFRQHVAISSSLKSREYGAKGLPFVMAGQSDVFEGKEFVLKVPENESVINILEVVRFYDKLYYGKSKLEVSESIRRQAENLCDIRITMASVIKYFDCGEFVP